MGGVSGEDKVEMVDAVIVGAGFAGMYALHRVRKLGMRAVVLERGDGIGGTWYWNRYPGARCDVESLEYSYTFDDALQREWVWSERYATQPEILRYLNHVADRFDLRKDIRLGARVIAAEFDEDSLTWGIGTAGGDRFRAPFFIAASGCLSEPNEPTYPGQEHFQGAIYYTSRWPHDGVDFKGKQVAVIGTGSSGIQAIPIIAAQAGHLTVLQRTPNFSVPAHNRPLTPDEISKVKAEHKRFREHNASLPFAFNLYVREESASQVSPEEREREFENRWNSFGGLQFLGAFNDILLQDDANREAADFIRRKIAQIVKDPVKAALLQPYDHAVGCKRLCSDTGYYETFNRPNVDLVDLRTTPISRIEAHGLRCGDALLEADAIVFATGFDAMSGALLKMNIVGRRGRKLCNEWANGPQTFAGLMSAGFPNLFMITGPGSPSVLTNMVRAIEDHVDWIAGCLEHMQQERLAAIEPTQARQQTWMEEVRAIAEATQFTGCNSWYSGSNIPGKARTFSVYVGFADYSSRIAAIARRRYTDFEFTRKATAA